MMDGRGVERGPIQLDIGIVLSNVGGNSSQDRNQFHGLFSLSGIDFGLYIGPSFNPFRTIGPSVGIGLLVGHNGFLVVKIGIHFRRTVGLAMLIPIVPIYGVVGVSLITSLPFPEEVKVAATMPLIFVPTAVVYQEELKKLWRRGTKVIRELQFHISSK